MTGQPCRERRHAPRARLATTASLFDKDKYLGVFRIDDLSAGGARVHGPTRLRHGRRYRMQLQLPGGQLELFASVVRSPEATDKHQAALAFEHKAESDTEDRIQGAVLRVLELQDRGGRVLVVDDFAPVRRVLGVQLRQLGYQPIGASCMEEARAHLVESPLSIDAALLDIELGPEDGLDLARTLADERPEVKRIVMSGRLFPGQLGLMVHRGLAHAALAKPWTEKELARAVAPMSPAPT